MITFWKTETNYREFVYFLSKIKILKWLKEEYGVSVTQNRTQMAIFYKTAIINREVTYFLGEIQKQNDQRGVGCKKIPKITQIWEKYFQANFLPMDFLPACSLMPESHSSYFKQERGRFGKFHKMRFFTMPALSKIPKTSQIW